MRNSIASCGMRWLHFKRIYSVQGEQTERLDGKDASITNMAMVDANRDLDGDGKHCVGIQVRKNGNRTHERGSGDTLKRDSTESSGRTNRAAWQHARGTS